MGNDEKVAQGSAMVTPRNQNRSRVSHRGTRTCDEPPHPLRILAGRESQEGSKLYIVIYVSFRGAVSLPHGSSFQECSC